MESSEGRGKKHAKRKSRSDRAPDPGGRPRRPKPRPASRREGVDPGGRRIIEKQRVRRRSRAAAGRVVMTERVTGVFATT